MFFLYVLKEEQNCPVSEVFDKFIKPLETDRFRSNFSEDYKEVLEQVKKQKLVETPLGQNLTDETQ